MTSRPTVLLLLLATLGIAGWWWWQERGGSSAATVRGREDPTPVPEAELAGRATGPTPATPIEISVPTRTPTWRLEGRVTAASGGGVAGATVETALSRGDLETLLASTVADRDGNYALDLGAARALGAFALGGTILRVLASADGHAPAEVYRSDPWPKTMTADLRLNLSLELAAGDLLRGRVVRPDGQPVGDARVACCDGRMRANAVTTLPDGRFRLPRPVGEEWFVLAFEPNLGVGRVPVGPDRALPDIVLLPTPTVEGTVEFADGSPVAGIGVAGDVSGTHDPCVSVEWRAGLTRTRTDGTFRLVLPNEGECSVYCDDPEHGVRCRTGDRGVRIIVRKHRIRVRVVDTEGRPLPGIGLSAMIWHPEHAAWLTDFLAGRTSADGARPEVDDMSGGTVSAADATVNYLAVPGSAWVFTSDVPGSATSEAALRVPAEGNETEITLVIGPQVGGGRVKLRVLDPEGKPVPLSLVDVETALGSTVFHDPVAGDVVLGPYAAGSVRVTAWPIRRPGDDGETPNLDSWLLHATARATVRDGAIIDVVLRSTWGGRLRVTLRSPAGGAKPDASYGVRAVATEDSVATLLMGQLPPPDSSSYSSAWTADHAALAATLLAPGTYRLEVSDGRTGWSKPLAQGLVTVRAREVVDVSLDLAAR